MVALAQSPVLVSVAARAGPAGVKEAAVWRSFLARRTKDVRKGVGLGSVPGCPGIPCRGAAIKLKLMRLQLRRSRHQRKAS